MKTVSIPFAALPVLLAGCINIENTETPPARSAPAATVATPPSNAAEALRGYYASLRATTQLPAMQTPRLSPAATVERIVFGSCNHHALDQDHWEHMVAADGDVALMIGDNIYGDYGWRGGAQLGSFQAAYRQQAGYPEFQRFMAAQPVYATWDDHDFGPNDSGGSFFAREWSETLFESFWNVPDQVRSRPGIYDSVTAGPDGQRVQIIMLDTRFFRDDLAEKPYSRERYPLGIYRPNTDTDATVLGDAQWRWLEAELARPADLRVLVSSIQVLTDAHDFEAWENFPLQREKLFRMLAARSESGLVMLSGDRHSGAVYSDTPAALGDRVWELTSSSLNLAFVRDDASEREPDPLRMTDMITQENFGVVDIDWAQRHVHLRLMDDDGGEILSRQIGF